MNHRYKMRTLVPLLLAGLFASGCEQVILQDLFRDSLIAGVKAELEKIPGLILEELFGSSDDNGDNGDNGGDGE